MLNNFSLDDIIIAYALKDKKYTMELVNSIDYRYFDNKQWAFKLVKEYFCDPKFKEIPTAEIVKAKLQEDSSLSQQDVSDFVTDYSALKDLAAEVDSSEFTWYLDKMRLRYNQKVQRECSEKVSTILSQEADESEKIKKANKLIKEATANIDCIYRKQTYKEGAIDQSAKERFARYEFTEKNPEASRGVLTGYREFDRITNGLHPGELMIIAGDTGCQPAGSKVLMADGEWKNVEDVSIGDEVLSPQYDGTVVANKIINTMKFDNRDTYVVRSRERQQQIKYRASHNHILPIIETMDNGTERVLNISIDDYNSRPDSWKEKTKIFTTPAYNLAEKSFGLSPYVVGIMLGNEDRQGMISTGNGVFDELLGFGIGLVPIQKKDNYKVVWSCIDGELANLISETVGTNRGSCRSIPKEYFLGSIAQRLDLLAGLIDSSGAPETYKTTSRQLAVDFGAMVNSVGGQACVELNSSNLTYVVHYLFGEFKPNTRILQRSGSAANTESPRNVKFAVEYCGKDTVYGFTLDGKTQWYITDDYIVTHNTGKSVYMHNIGVNAYLGKNSALSPISLIDQGSGHNVLYFSLEMPKESIERRIDSCMGDLFYNQIRDGILSADDKKKYFNTLKFQMNFEKKFYVVDMPRKISTRDIELKYMEILDSKFIPELVIVDYMGIMSPNDRIDGSSGGAEADWLSLGQITEDLHEFARVYNVPVITGSQVNRPKDASKQTYSTDRIARSGMAPTNANVVIQIGKREDEYLRTDMPVYITKMRDGEQGSYTLNKNFAKMKVSDLAETTFDDEQSNDTI